MKFKILLPHFIFGTFVIVLISTSLLTEIFKTPKNIAQELIKNIQVFRKEEINKIQTLILTNKNGLFQFERSQTSELSPWLMSSPEQTAANGKIFEKILTSLITSKIKKTIPANQENLENYSLSNANASLEFINDLNKRTKITMGLQNPIDKSTFIWVENNPDIYQIDSFEIDVESLRLNDLIEKDLFAINRKNLTALHIYNGLKKNETLIVNLIKNPNEIKGWRMSDKEAASEEKIFQYIEKLENLKPVTIIENANDIQRNKMTTLLQNPKWVITTEDSNQNTISYTITNFFNSFPNLETKGEAYFVIKISNQESYYFFKKESLDIFETNKTDFSL